MSTLETNDYVRKLKEDAPLVSAEHIRSVFHRYCQYMTEGNVEAIVALYAPDATLEDPVGSHFCQGHDEIRQFYQWGFDWAGGSFRTELDGAIRVTKTAGACAMIAICDKIEEPLRIETLDVFTFNEQGLVTSMRAYHGVENRHPI